MTARGMFTRGPGTALLGFVLVLSWASGAHANYPWRIPNGYSTRTDATTGRCGVCHVSSAGGGERTPFGEAFRLNGHTWNRALAEVDSDGDGWSNGQELGDPFALWVAASVAGDPPPPTPGTYPSFYRANPGVRSNQPTDSSLNLCSIAAMHDCDVNSTCSRNSGNGIGDWNCSCDPGYTANVLTQGHRRSQSHSFSQNVNGHRLYDIRSLTTGCFNINECSPNPCGPGTCSENAPGAGYTCNCNAGYAFSLGMCRNINECTAMPGICGPGTCMDLVGSHNCVCDPGFEFDGTTCSVSNACLANTDDCHREATCTPVGDTSWNCTCNAGWLGTGTLFRGTGDRCADINECTARPGPCGPGVCTNTAGGYGCACSGGYVYNGTTCVDVDECLSSPCGVGGTGCSNSVGSFSCSCAPGYAFDGATCADIDECASSPCGVGTCSESEPPGYSCSCGAGFTFDGVTCVDIDECADPTVSRCSADAVCENSPGEFRCVCNDGFGGDGFNCIDIDECATATHDCDPNARCTNTTPGFTCACRDHYEGSGAVCADVDECALGTHGCVVNEICVNREGEVNLCACRPGFAREADEGPCVAACGNGERTPGEACDDLNTADGDGCSATCEIEDGWACYAPTGVSECVETCGDGLIDPPAEDCDDGEANSDSDVDGCRTSCRRAYCGDGVLDTGEVCDASDAVSDTEPDACRTSCVPAYCGDGVVDTGEACDPGGDAMLDAAACNTSCGPADAGVDGGAGEVTDGGCGCRAAGASDESAPWWLALPLGLALLRRRRR